MGSTRFGGGLRGRGTEVVMGSTTVTLIRGKEDTLRSERGPHARRRARGRHRPSPGGGRVRRGRFLAQRGDRCRSDAPVPHRAPRGRGAQRRPLHPCGRLGATPRPRRAVAATRVGLALRGGRLAAPPKRLVETIDTAGERSSTRIPTRSTPRWVDDQLDASEITLDRGGTAWSAAWATTSSASAPCSARSSTFGPGARLGEDVGRSSAKQAPCLVGAHRRHRRGGPGGCARPAASHDRRRRCIRSR